MQIRFRVERMDLQVVLRQRQVLLHCVPGQRGSEHEHGGTGGKDRRERHQDAGDGAAQILELAPAAEYRAQYIDEAQKIAPEDKERSQQQQGEEPGIPDPRQAAREQHGVQQREIR